MKGEELRIDTQILKRIRMNYLLYLPPGYQAESDKKWPLILYLHGAGGSGTMLDAVRKEGLPARMESGAGLPFVVVAPQCPLGVFWNTREDEVLAILDEVADNRNIDPSRVYLTGFSMGAYGVWQMASHHSYRFAAIAPVSGGGDPAYARRLRDMPAWIFHGKEDRVIRVSESEKIAEAMREAGAEVELTIYPEAGHDCWKKVYANDALYRWFLEHSAIPPRSRKPEPNRTEEEHVEETIVHKESRNGEDEKSEKAAEAIPIDSAAPMPSRLYEDGTERLRIESVKEDDIDDLLAHEIKNKAFFRRYAATREETFYTREEQAARVRRAMTAAAADQRYQFLVRDRETGLLIGGVDLMGVARGSLQSAWIGYSLDQDYNGRGYMTEAVRFVVRHAFEILALHRIEAGVMPHNAASLRVLEKAGFEREGLSRRNVKIDGRWRDHVLLAVINPKDLAEEERLYGSGGEEKDE
ncbi:hypothetical protein CDO73_03665 [Saccharibacillus sp. O23]|uniref:GNAT family N-acetyltransferase n=1 Tax=Saccharibacillus sp. O23 TaxID=2009338 RepID=UPI000B4E2C6F|nr:GNAT family N-acetyltransferase [Saccharibacillus sp. O23]OWR32709.1 hypothetical protein CDO73_03665 [Saccharibacillus sp. O23]